MTIKKQLAVRIVEELYDIQSSHEAQAHFERTVQNKELPQKIEEVQLADDDDEYLNEDLLVDLNLASSKSDAKRLFEQGAVELNGERILSSNANTTVENGAILKVGKKKIVKLLKP